MNAQPQRDLGAIVGASLWAFALGTIGAWVTDLGPWYFGLRKPAWQPPDFLFGPAWTVIFILAAMAGYRAWVAARDPGDKTVIATLFAINAAANVAWSWLFFRTQRPDWALYEVVLLWLSILVPIIVLARFSKAASWLMVPYLLWVSFAAFLNFTVVQLNQPFV